MSPHALTIILMLSNGQMVETRVGTLDNLPFCDLAGLGIATVLTQQDPTLAVGWRCDPVGGTS